MNNRISLQNIEDSIRVIDPVFLNTPEFIAESLGEMWSMVQAG